MRKSGKWKRNMAVFGGIFLMFLFVFFASALTVPERGDFSKPDNVVAGKEEMLPKDAVSGVFVENSSQFLQESEKIRGGGYQPKSETDGDIANEILTAGVNGTASAVRTLEKGEEAFPEMSDMVKFSEGEDGTMPEPYTGEFSSNHSLTGYGGGSIDYSNLSDGSAASFISFSSGTQTGDWLQMDLREIKSVGNVCVMVGDGSNADSTDKWVKYHLAYSVDGIQWFSLASSTGAATGMDTYTVNLGGVVARYIKLVCDDETKNSWVRFSEFSVYPPAGEEKFAVAASDFSWPEGWSGDAANLIDGNDDTYVHYNVRQSAEAPYTNSILKGDYIQVNLGSLKSIGRVRIVVGGDNADKFSKYHLEYAGADNEWKKVKGSECVGSDSGKDYYIVNLNGIQAQYIRVVSDDDNELKSGDTIVYGKAKWAKFSEFSVYPYVQPNAPTGYHIVTYVDGNSCILAQQLVADGERANYSVDDILFDGWYKDADLFQPYDLNASVTEDMTLYAGWLEAEKYEASKVLYIEATENNDKGQPKNGWCISTGSIANLIDGNDSTFVEFNTYQGADTDANTSQVGDYLGLDLGEVKNIGRIRILVGAENDNKWVKYHLEYSIDGINWIRSASCGNGVNSGIDIFLDDLGGKAAQYVRLVNDEKRGKWIRFSEFTVYSAAAEYTVTFSSNGGTPEPNELTVKSGRKIQEPTEPVKEGCTFDGWYKDESFTTAFNFNEDIITADTILYAKWTPYKVIFHKNDNSSPEIMSEETVNQNGTIEGQTPGWAVDTDNLTFAGWYTDSACGDAAKHEIGTKITYDMLTEGVINLYAKWTATVTFDLGFSDAGITPPNSETVVFNQKATKPADPKIEGYIFKYWYQGDDDTQEFNFNTSIISNITLKAKWAQERKVVFHKNDGTDTTKEQVVEVGSQASALEKPNWTSSDTLDLEEKWYTEAACTNEYDFAGTIASGISSLDLYAKWTATVEFLKNDGSAGEAAVYKKQTVQYNSSITAPEPAPTREGYDFDKWYKAEQPSVSDAPFDFSNENITCHTKLYANWNIKKYTVTFQANNGTANTTQTDILYNTKVTKPENPTNGSKNFAGWFTDEGCTKEYNFDSGVKSSFTLYAKWTDKPIFIVTFVKNADDAELSLSSSTVESGNTVAEPTITRPHWTFKGWYIDEILTEESKPYVFSTPVTAAMTLYAHWERITYTVTFDTDGAAEQVPSQTVNSGECATLPVPEPTKTGYKFAGWYLPDAAEVYNFEETPVTEPITLIAKWNSVYEITFHKNDGSDPEVTAKAEVEAGKKIPDDVFPDWAHDTDLYKFEGWYTDAEGNTPYDVSEIVSEGKGSFDLYAKWTLKSDVEPTEYTVTFDADGGTPEPAAQKVESGKTAAEPTAPTKEGYDFAGWYLDDAATAYDFDTEVTSNITLTARWTKKDTSDHVIEKTYIIKFNSNYGTPVKSQTVKQNGRVSAALAVTKRNGYIFDGWYLDTAFKTKYNFNTPVTKNMTLYAKWKKNTPPAQPKKVSALTFEEINLKIAQGKKVNLKDALTILPADAANKTLIWTSLNPKVATVIDGVVTVKKNTAGKTVTITATAADGSKTSASVKIKVMKNAVTKITVKSSKTAKAGKTLKIKVNIKTNGRKVNKKLKYISSNPEYATVNSKGKVKFTKAGKGKKVKITVMTTDGSNKKKTITIKIK